MIHIDGKTLRRSHDSAIGKTPLKLVNAWASANHLVLGQVKVADDSNEITAIPALLKVLALKGCTVTIDAIGTQKEIAAEDTENKKRTMYWRSKTTKAYFYEGVAESFQDGQQTNFKDIAHDYWETMDKDHGRIETRQVLDDIRPRLSESILILQEYGKI